MQVAWGVLRFNLGDVCCEQSKGSCFRLDVEMCVVTVWSEACWSHWLGAMYVLDCVLPLCRLARWREVPMVCHVS